MALIKTKPTSPGRRFVVKADRSHLHKGEPVHALTSRRSSTGARNNMGRITTRHKGGGHSQTYRIVDFLRDKDGIAGQGRAPRVRSEPHRAPRAGAVRRRRASLHPRPEGRGAPATRSSRAPMRRSSRATRCRCATSRSARIVHNVELKPGKGGQLARSAGASVQLIAREGLYATIRLRSTEMRKVHVDCRATIGEVGNDEHNLIVYGKAGAKRWRGIRPTVRGVVMNPVDHPHGGGEGKSGQGNPHPVSPWGWKTKGKKTRTNKRTAGHDRPAP